MQRLLSLLASPLQLLAVLAFFLPFYSVSCQGRPIATASGYEIATGGFDTDRRDGARIVEAAVDSSMGDARDRGVAVWLLLVPALAAAAGVAAGLSAIGKRSAAETRSSRLASAVLGAAGAVVLLIHYVVVSGQLRNAMRDAPGSSSGAGSEFASKLGRAMAASVTLDVQVGWWLALGGLIVGTALVGASLVLPEEASPPATPSPGQTTS